MNFIKARLKEPSTYAALAAILAMFGVHVDAGALQSVFTAAAGLSGLAGMFMRG